MKHMVVVYEIEDDDTLEGMLPIFPKAKSISMTSGVRVRQLSSGEEAVIPYARWFDSVSSNSWQSGEQFGEYNWMFLRNQQTWANDILRVRGHLVLNDIFSMLGMSHTSMGAVVGWTYNSKTEPTFVDFGCWEQRDNQIREDAILLDFNVQGPILHAIR